MSALPPIAQLEARLHEPLPVHERVRILNAISEQLYDRDASRGLALAKEAVGLARATGDTAGEAQALYCCGRNLYVQADFPEVFETQNTALALFRHLGDAHGEARCTNLLGITHRQLSDYDRALELYEQALRGFRETGDRRWQARVLSNIGNIEIQLGNHVAALALFEQALELRRETGDEEGAGFDLNNAAHGRIQRAITLRQGGDDEGCQSETERALRLLDRALAIARQFGYARLESVALLTMGEAYQAMARADVALAMGERFLQLARVSEDPVMESYGLAVVGELRLRNGDAEGALRDLRGALTGFEAAAAMDQVARVQRSLSDVHEARGELEAALRCIRQASSIERQLRSEESQNRARALATRRRLDRARVESERYRRLAIEDAVTGLANRRQLDERLSMLLREAQKAGATLTVALADVDHFKGINDRFSQAVGNEVLRCVGEILRGHCRLGDVAGRFGGEEFMLLFRNLDMRGAAEICERIRRAVEAYDWPSIHPHLRVTLSMGLASSSSFDQPQGLLDGADHWLFEAKHHGRNQIQPVMLTPA